MMKQDATDVRTADPPHWSTQPAVPLDAAPVDSDDPEPLMTSLAEALVFFESRVTEIARPLSDDDVEALVKRCRREAHPQPGDSHNFVIPAWDGVAELLEREIRFRCIICILVLEEALRTVSGIGSGEG